MSLVCNCGYLWLAYLKGVFYFLRVEILMWFVLQGRLNTREWLLILNIIPNEVALCHFYQTTIESLEHLSFKCALTWKLGIKCWSRWEIQWSYPNKPISFFQAWCGVNPYGVEKKMWVSFFFFHLNMVYMQC